MIYTAIDTFYLTDEQLENSPSRKDGIDIATETTLRIYGCDLIQESGILLRLYRLFDSFFLMFFMIGGIHFRWEENTAEIKEHHEVESGQMNGKKKMKQLTYQEADRV